MRDIYAEWRHISGISQERQEKWEGDLDAEAQSSQFGWFLAERYVYKCDEAMMMYIFYLNHIYVVSMLRDVNVCYEGCYLLDSDG